MNLLKERRQEHPSGSNYSSSLIHPFIHEDTFIDHVIYFRASARTEGDWDTAVNKAQSPQDLESREKKGITVQEARTLMELSTGCPGR